MSHHETAGQTASATYPHSVVTSITLERQSRPRSELTERVASEITRLILEDGKPVEFTTAGLQQQLADHGFSVSQRTVKRIFDRLPNLGHPLHQGWPLVRLYAAADATRLAVRCRNRSEACPKRCPQGVRTAPQGVGTRAGSWPKVSRPRHQTDPFHEETRATPLSETARRRFLVQVHLAANVDAGRR